MQNPGQTRPITTEEITLRQVAACRNMAKFIAEAIGDDSPAAIYSAPFDGAIIVAGNGETDIRRWFPAGAILLKSRLWMSGIALVFLRFYLEGKDIDAT